MTSEPQLLPAHIVGQYIYCERSAYLQWVDGEWDDNLDTITGRWAHRRVDDEPATPVPGPNDKSAPGPEKERTLTARSVTLSSDRLGVIARLDLMEASGRVATPVEYKKGKVPEGGQVRDTHRVQLCLQGLILRDNGYQCEGGVVYYAGSRKRVPVRFDDELIALTESTVQKVREMGERRELPPPLVDSPRCVRCALNAICLPDETGVWSGDAERSASDVRRLRPARSDALPLHVQQQGGTIGVSGDALYIRLKDEAPRTVRFIDILSVSVYGYVQITTQALRALQNAGIPVALHNLSGWLTGHIDGGTGHKNVEVRVRQHSVAASEDDSLLLARRIVEGKIINQRTMLRRNMETRDTALLGSMAQLSRQTRGAQTLAVLMGLEGMAARHYFGALSGLLRNNGAWAGEIFAVNRRNRRPPKDEVNATLSFLYALLVREATSAVMVTGFDPYVGFLHRPHYGRLSAALDLAEEFRPLISDSVAIRLFNEGTLVRDHFVRRARGVALTPAGRTRVITAHERRMNQTVTHPLFGYTVSYRRIVELQARLLRAVLLGEAPEYRAFTSR